MGLLCNCSPIFRAPFSMARVSSRPVTSWKLCRREMGSVTSENSWWRHQKDEITFSFLPKRVYTTIPGKFQVRTRVSFSAYMNFFRIKNRISTRLFASGIVSWSFWKLLTADVLMSLKTVYAYPARHRRLPF